MDILLLFTLYRDGQMKNINREERPREGEEKRSGK
jgi:hypothetical protein